MLEPVTSKDIMRLQQELLDVAFAVQAKQMEMVAHLSIRDQMIVCGITSQKLHVGAEIAMRKTAGQRFLRSVREAFSVARNFGSGDVNAEREAG